MPEGDSVHKAANALRPLLVGRPLERVTTRGGLVHRALEGRMVKAVEAHGKHMTVELEGDAIIRVHLRMRGKWRRYRQGEEWDWGTAGVTLALETKEDALVCYRAWDVEITTATKLRWAGTLERLGPDLIAEAPDLDEVMRRARAGENAERAIGELLLDQSVAAGVGNVYKSEVLFLARIDPWKAVGELDDETLRKLYERASDLLKRNVTPGPRTTTGERNRSEPGAQKLWVYGRARRPCPRCQTPIKVRKQGEAARATWYCERCQK